MVVQVIGLVGSSRKRTLMLWQAVELSRMMQRPDLATLQIARKALEPPDDPLEQVCHPQHFSPPLSLPCTMFLPLPHTPSLDRDPTGHRCLTFLYPPIPSQLFQNMSKAQRSGVLPSAVCKTLTSSSSQVYDL